MSIPVKNIYYMLSYAFQELKNDTYKNVGTESFDNVVDMCAAILIKGVSLQLKRGLGRDYIDNMESLSMLRGKIEMGESIRTLSMQRMQIVCSFDEFSLNTKMNRILKSTMRLLLSADVKPIRKKELKKLLVYFNDLDLLDLNRIDWRFKFNKNNQPYRLLMGICNLVVDGLLQTQENGTKRLMNFLDEQKIWKLYEKFVLAYYKKHYGQFHPDAKQIKWPIDEGYDDTLPKMQSDIMLTRDSKVLIIDTKHYSSSMQVHFDKHTIHSHNLYQIFTYVKSMEYWLAKKVEFHEVSGMLLYAKTDEDISPDCDLMMSGNKFVVRTLDLNCDFTQIKEQLDKIVQDYL